MNLKTFAKRFTVGLGLSAGLLAGASAETLKIGVIASLTGPGAPWGLATQYGPKILAAEVNAKGGLDVGGKKYQVEVIAYDDQYKAADAVAAYNRLVRQDGVKYVILMSSASTMALKQSFEDDKVLALTAAATSKAIDANTKYMFRIITPPADYVPPLISWLKNNVKGNRVVILNPNDETGWDQAQLSNRFFKQNNYEVLGNDMYERTQKDFQPIFTKIFAMKPEVIDLGGTPPATAGLMLRQARELGYKGLFMKTGGAGPKDIVAGAGKEAAEGMVSVLYADPSNEGYKRLAAEYKKAIGQEPNEIIVIFYDAISVLLQAIQKAGDARDTTKVAAAFAQALPMKSIQGDTLTLGGKATIGGDQQIMSVTYIGAIKNGQAVVVGKTK
ncbi:ABC transporter substrate-binding protein [Noviherbaspirillum sedimenti]|uniref:ABC transporter substrate-binding protein n=1 Tax=Noviherbaspirillum sedimenti TaxID=2320865 RepID=A0A3A3G982_9BURK|nr:ABC transporter substrate-binding protein [Noviherbaspirillum sedimenti]RJG03299.1 ABC transporter substrate-binding protein [Noviherbaspirillum sedimenti]